MNRLLPKEAVLKVISNIRNGNLGWKYDPEKHRILLPDETTGEDSFILRLHITLPAPDKDLSFPKNPLRYVILLVQSGSCAVGYFENGINLDHKVFRAYMVRKKRGVSQIKHLKTKGKSRAGSRVRLAETE